MKKLTFFILVTLALSAIFSSCKKDEQSIETPILVLSNSNTALTALYPGFESLQYDLQVAPEDVVDGKITLKITTNADTIGFEFEVNTTAGNYTEGKIRYLYARATGLVKVGNHSDSTNKMIKVNPTGDELVIEAGNNIIVKSYPVICNEILKYSYWSSSSTASIFLYGYSYLGTETKQIEVWSTRDNQHVNVDGRWDNPSLYQGLPAFNNFNFRLSFNDGFSYPADTLVGIYPEGDTLFIKYNTKTYWQLYNSSSTGLLNEI